MSFGRYVEPASHAGPEIDNIQAVFGTSPPAGGFVRKVVIAEPFRACTRLRNNCTELEGSILLVERGGCSFTTKALIARLSCPQSLLNCSELAADCNPTLPGTQGAAELVRWRCPKTCRSGVCSSAATVAPTLGGHRRRETSYTTAVPEEVALTCRCVNEIYRSCALGAAAL